MASRLSAHKEKICDLAAKGAALGGGATLIIASNKYAVIAGGVALAGGIAVNAAQHLKGIKRR